MNCDKCNEPIGTQAKPAYQVRVGWTDDGITFEVDEDIGYYCSECLSEGV